MWLGFALAACGGATPQASCLAVSSNSYHSALPTTHGSKPCTTVATGVFLKVTLEALRSLAGTWRPGAIGWVTRVPCSGGGGNFTCHPHVREQTSGLRMNERVVQYRTDVSCTGSGAHMRCRLNGLKFEKVLYSGPTQNGEVTNP